jgi:hypothetical protein
MPLELKNVNGSGFIELRNLYNSGYFSLELSGSEVPTTTTTTTSTTTTTTTPPTTTTTSTTTTTTTAAPTTTTTTTTTTTSTTTTTTTSAGTDQLRAQLTASLSAYDAASVNNWVKITKTEYDKIFANITGATKRGNTDIQVATRAVAAGFSEMTFAINNNTGSALTIDTNEYPIAFVAETWNTIQTVQFGYTTTYRTGTPTYGNSAAINPVGANYYVRKAPTGIESAPATQTLYPTIKINGGSFNLVPNTSGWYTTNGGTTWIAYQGNAGNGAAKFQMIVTTTKSW